MQPRSFAGYKRHAVALVCRAGARIRTGRRRARSARFAALGGQAPAGADIGGVAPITQATPISADQASQIARLRQENDRPWNATF